MMHFADSVTILDQVMAELEAGERVPESVETHGGRFWLRPSFDSGIDELEAMSSKQYNGGQLPLGEWAVALDFWRSPGEPQITVAVYDGGQIENSRELTLEAVHGLAQHSVALFEQPFEQLVEYGRV